MYQVKLIVGNTYSRIPGGGAKLDRSGKHRKIHDWELYVDVPDGKQDVIERVTFDLGTGFSPQKYTCRSPIPIAAKKSWRFHTRQQSYAPIKATIEIVGAGGSRSKLSPYTLCCEGTGKRTEAQTFVEENRLQKIPIGTLPPDQQFGIELELTTMVDLERIVARSRSQQDPNGIRLIRNYNDGRENSSGWKIVPDSSITCNLSEPNCNTFELVSPILRGESGLKQVSIILDQVKANANIKVNKSMGFHVHIDVSSLSIAQLRNVCQNFIKYEGVMDSFLPPSRRTGSAQSNSFFKSNRDSISPSRGHEAEAARSKALEGCSTLNELVNYMNPNGRYYKLNFQNLATGRQPTLEFRQHSATTDFEKVSAWVRFCVAMVRNSARLRPPTHFAPNRSLSHQTDALFFYCIKDRALGEKYRKRQLEVNNDACCTSCAIEEA